MKPLLVLVFVTLMKTVAADSEYTSLNLTTIEKTQISGGVSNAIKEICDFLKDGGTVDSSKPDVGPKKDICSKDPTLKACVLRQRQIFNDIKNICENIVLPLDKILGRDKETKGSTVSLASLPDDDKSTVSTTTVSGDDDGDESKSSTSTNVTQVDDASTVTTEIIVGVEGSPPKATDDDKSTTSITDTPVADASTESTTTISDGVKGSRPEATDDDKSTTLTTLTPVNDASSESTTRIIDRIKSKPPKVPGKDKTKETSTAATTVDDASTVSTTEATGDDIDITTDNSVTDKYLGTHVDPQEAQMYPLGTVLGSAFGALIFGIILAFVGLMLYKRYRLRGESYTIPPEQGLQMQN